VPGDHHLVQGIGAGAGGGLTRDYDGGMQRAYLGSTRILSVLLIVLGIALVVSSVARGGGVLALGVVIGVCFTLTGAGRLWLMRGVRGEPR
jgi:hypothetical protein